MSKSAAGDRASPPDHPEQTARQTPEQQAQLIRALVEKHHAALYRYAFRLSGTQADAEDLTQQTYLLATERLSQLRDPAKAGSWLYAILRSCFLKSYRKTQPLPAGLLDLEMDEFPSQLPPQEEVDGERLQMALDELPAEFRLVLVMYYFEECSYKEIAAQLEIPVGTVMSRLSRGKTHLRRALLPHMEQQAGRPRQPDDKSGPDDSTSGRARNKVNV